MKSNSIILYFLLFTLVVFDSVKTCAGDNVKKSADDNRDDNGDTNEESKDESLDIPIEPVEPSSTNNRETSINTTSCTRRQNNQMHEIRAAEHRQFPFMASIMSNKYEHLCSGTVVSNGLILTTAHCTQMALSYVLVNTTRSKKDETTAALHVRKTERFPTFTAADSDKDVGLIYTEKHNNSIAAKVRLSNYTSARSLISMEVIGFGLNADVGQIKELQYIGVEHRISPTYQPFQLASELTDSLNGYIDCIDTKVPTCFKDTGGPSIFDNELIGIVVSGDDKCFKELTSAYALNKKVVDILPTFTFKAWLDEKIKKNEEQDLVALATFPNKPVSRRRYEKVKLASKGSSLVTHYLVVGIICLKMLLVVPC